MGDAEDAVAGKAILYTHGGAYVSGSPSTHEPLIARLAQSTKIPVMAYEYRLAPEHPYPAALEDALAAFDYLLEKAMRNRISRCAAIRRAAGSPGPCPEAPRPWQAAPGALGGSSSPGPI